MGFQLGAAFAVLLAASASPSSTVNAPPAGQQQSVPTIEPAQVKAMQASGMHFVLVDVREPDEYAAGHIDGATLMPLGTVEANYSKLPKDAKLVVYCRSGKRSAKAVSILQSHGYDRAVSMSGGYLAWTALPK